MSHPSTGITLRTIQEAMPEYHIDTDLIGGVLTAMPPLPPDASAAWRRARLTRVIEEVAARVPMDAAQGTSRGRLSSCSSSPMRCWGASRRRGCRWRSCG